jgi:hypothetical protein
VKPEHLIMPLTRPRGPLRRALVYSAGRRNPALRAHQWPFWVRHPILWAVLRLPRYGWRLTRLLVYGARHHRWLTPYVVAGWLWTVSAVFGAVPNGWRTLMVLAVLGGALMWRQLGLPLPALRRHTTHTTRQRIQHAAVYIVGAGLTIAAAAYRPLLWIPGPLLLWATVAPWLVGWWRLPEAKPEAPSIDGRLRRWDQKIAGQGKKLAGAKLIDIAAIRTERAS